MKALIPVKEMMRQSLSSLFNYYPKKTLLLFCSPSVCHSPLEAKLMTVHDDKAESEIDEQTGEDYVQWRKTFDISAQTDTITKILQEDEALRAMHTKLVPQQVSYATFWGNYFWQLHLQEALTRKRLSILRRMQKTGQNEGEESPSAADAPESTEAPAAANEAAAGESGEATTASAESKGEAAATPAERKSVSSVLAEDDDEEMGWGSDDE